MKKQPHPKSLSKGEGLVWLLILLSPLLWRGAGGEVFAQNKKME
ncbi:MAG: hypothetical protein ACYDCN_15275 [Bacteroidia bacterium]